MVVVVVMTVIRMTLTVSAQNVVDERWQNLANLMLKTHLRLRPLHHLHLPSPHHHCVNLTRHPLLRRRPACRK
jgi:hypothetical protein